MIPENGNKKLLSHETIKERRLLLEEARKQAIRGDPICGALFGLESMAHAAGLGFIATSAQDWRDEDEDDDIRPY